MARNCENSSLLFPGGSGCHNSSQKDDTPFLSPARLPVEKGSGFSTQDSKGKGGCNPCSSLDMNAI